MIYTVGHTENYSSFFRDQKEPGFPKKKGRTATHEGGWVWKTYAEALAECPPGFSVYGVLANWDTEATPNIPQLLEVEVFSNPDTRWLLVDSTLVEVQEVKIAEPNVLGRLAQTDLDNMV